MARPRTPAAVLELRGAFRKNPQRKRTDAAGNAPLNPRVPRHLPTDCAPAWRQIIERLPRVAVFDCDELAVEVAARLLTEWRNTADLRTARELRAWLVELGFSPRARTHLGVRPPPVGDRNPFEDFA